jgi:hypothetical protein
LEAEGFSVEDVSATQSVDFRAKRGIDVLYVEVKGSTGPLGSVLLTANEVALHQKAHPNNALIVVHSIKLDRTSDRPNASGGCVVQFRPWPLKAENLRPISYQYALGPTKPPVE